jgi:hypothetical protein
MHERERILQRYGAVQHAAVARRQLRRAGLTDGQIDHLVAIGRLLVEFDGVYRISGAPVTWNQRMLAACLYTGGDASHRAAAAVWGVDGPLAPFELTIEPRRGFRHPGLVLHRTSSLAPNDLTRRHGIPVTNPLRTLVDLGAVAGHDEVANALDSLTSRRIITIAGARAYRQRLAGRGRRGVGVLGDVLDNRALGDQASDGMLEPAMADLCRRFAIPMPAFQVWVFVAGRWRRMDFADVDAMIDFEVDGYEQHGGNYRNWEDDLDRDAELTALGWQVVRFSWTAVNHRPVKVARLITDVRRQRRRSLGAA